jgi:hypothetical protein
MAVALDVTGMDKPSPTGLELGLARLSRRQSFRGEEASCR